MNKLLKFFVIPVVVIMLSLTATGAANAGPGDMKYGYHLGDAFLGCGDVKPTDDPILATPGTPTCRPEAVAEDSVGAFPGEGGSIAIQGEGEIKVSKKGKRQHVNGGGLYAQFDQWGNEFSSGTWKAKKLLSFDAYGEDNTTPFPDGFEAGRVLMLIELKPEGGKKGKKIDAVLEIGCRLPGNKGKFGTIEGARVLVDGGLNYNIAADPKSTLFVNLKNFVP